MRIYSSEHTFEHPWETVTTAACRKYPNPLNPSVLSMDIIDRKVKDGVLYTHRLVSSTWHFPKWLERTTGGTPIYYASEQSKVDPTVREMVVKTKNLSLSDYVTVSETLVYSAHPTDANKTVLRQNAVVEVSGLPAVTGYVEDLLTKAISFNANQGRRAIEWVIDKFEEEVKGFAYSAVKSTDELLHQTRRQLDDLTIKTKKSMDDLQNVALKSLDEIQNLTTPTAQQSMPKL